MKGKVERMSQKEADIEEIIGELLYVFDWSNRSNG
jgi:hypothetical protein